MTYGRRLLLRIHKLQSVSTQSVNCQIEIATLERSHREGVIRIAYPASNDEPVIYLPLAEQVLQSQNAKIGIGITP